MSRKIIGTIGNSKPIRMWIDGKCFNIKETIGISSKRLKQNEVNSVEDNSEINEDVTSFDKIDIDVTDDGRVSTSFELPPLYYVRLYNQTLNLNSIRNKTNTVITLPKLGNREKMVISGNNVEKLKEAIDEVHSLIGQIRSTSPALQFIAIPLLSDEIKNNFNHFKNEILKDKDTRGLDESIFQSEEKLHLTVEVFVLLDDQEKKEATECLQKYQENILKPMVEKSGPLQIHIAGLECMNDNYENVDVLYAKAKLVNETEDINLQKIVNDLSAYFYEKGLLKSPSDNVKLHMTLLNTKYRKRANIPRRCWQKRIHLDARTIMKKYKDYEFGKCDFKSIHISNIGSKGADGFYTSLASIEF